MDEHKTNVRQEVDSLAGKQEPVLSTVKKSVKTMWKWHLHDHPAQGMKVTSHLRRNQILIRARMCARVNVRMRVRLRVMVSVTWVSVCPSLQTDEQMSLVFIKSSATVTAERLKQPLGIVVFCNTIRENRRPFMHRQHQI